MSAASASEIEAKIIASIGTIDLIIKYMQHTT